jgi:hypothetical protein
MNLSRFNRFDSHIDFENGWIEEAIYFVENCLSLEIEEEEIIERLKENWNVPDERVFFIFMAGKMLYRDEEEHYNGS